MRSRLKEVFKLYFRDGSPDAKNQRNLQSYKTDSIGNIIELSISGVDLAASTDVFGSISKLTFLNTVDFNGSAINKFKSLQILILKDCKLKNIDFILDLPGLEILDLSNNQIENIQSLTILNGLKQLNLSWNFIDDLFPLKKLKKLETLFLENCELKNIDFVSNLSRLRKLDLSCNKIDSAFPLESLINLEELNLSNNRIVSVLPLKNLKKLLVLYLNNNKIKNIEPLEWIYLTDRLKYGERSYKGESESINNIRLKLHNNPIIVPPPSVMYDCNEAIQSWFKRESYKSSDRIRILYLDDDSIDLFVSRKIFEVLYPESFSIITTFNIQDALDIMTSQKIDLLLLNMNMPVMSGFDVAMYMDNNNIKIPTIMVTQSVSYNDLDRISNTPNIDAYFSKPVTPAAKKVIDEVLDKRSKLSAETEVKEFDLGLTLVDNQVKLVKLYKDGRYDLLDSENNKYQLLHSYFQSENLNELIDEFEQLINKKNVKEIELQNFFERNPDFILNDDYKIAHSKFKLTLEDGVNNNFLVPDFILEPHEPSSLCDILEIKLPNVKLFTIKKNRVRYSSAVLEVCAQLRTYATYFEDGSNRTKMSNLFGLNVYRPRMIALIGRRKDVEPIQLKRVESDFPGLQLITYDEVLSKMKRKRGVIH